MFFEQLLLLRGYAFNHSADFETVRIMKEKLCYIGYNIETEQKLARETTVLVQTYTVSEWIPRIFLDEYFALKINFFLPFRIFNHFCFLISYQTVEWLKWAEKDSKPPKYYSNRILSTSKGKVR